MKKLVDSINMLVMLKPHILGYTTFINLTFNVGLFYLKSLNKISDEAFTKILQVLKKPLRDTQLFLQGKENDRRVRF